MSAPITEFVDIDVLVAGAQAEKFNFGSLMGAFSHTVNAARQNGPFFSVPELVAAGFTSVAEPEVHAWGSRVFDQENGIDQVLVGLRDGGDANLTVSLDAIEAADPSTFYGVNIDTRVDADIALLAAWVEARNGGNAGRKIAVAQSDDLTLVAFLAMQSANYNRTAGIYHANDTEWLDGAWSSKGLGFNLDGPDGAGTWNEKPLSGVPFDKVTGAQATAIYAADANLFGRLKSLNFTSKGKMASGRSIDITTTIDWVATRMEEAILSLFVGTPTKIPYTNAGINTVAAKAQEILNAGVRNGHFASEADSLPGARPEIRVPNVLTIDPQLKIAKTLPLIATATFAGSIEKLELTLNVTF